MQLIPAAAQKLPERSPFAVEQVLDDDFFPE
jgi:hypothetical protein